MIDCKFVFKFENGGASDSLTHTHKVHAVPRVGEYVSFIDAAGSCAQPLEVKDIIHHIDQHKGTHEITVMYGERK